METEAYCKQSEAHILKQTRFRMHIREKQHLSFAELVALRASKKTTLSGRPDVLGKPGNCIASALAHHMDDYSSLVDELSNPLQAHNVVAQNRSVRAYSLIQKLTGFTLVPSLGCNVKEIGMYLIHSEGDGTPHCVAVRHTVAGAVHVLDGDVEWEMPINVLDQVTVECVDRATLVTFIVYKQSGIQTALTPPPFPDAYAQ